MPSPVWAFAIQPELAEELRFILDKFTHSHGFNYIFVSRRLLWLYRESDIFAARAPCGMIHVRAQCTGASFSFEVLTDTHFSTIEQVVTNTPSVPLHYHKCNNWIMACSGSESRRLFQLPVSWTEWTDWRVADFFQNFLVLDSKREYEEYAGRTEEEEAKYRRCAIFDIAALAHNLSTM